MIPRHAQACEHGNDRDWPPCTQCATKRVGWDQYFMRIAIEVSTRATCDRRHVGAVLVRDRVILATGYNGSLRGLPHCDDEGHLMIDGHCERTVHAEANAIAQAAGAGTRVAGSVLYVSTYPCFTCFKLVANAGVGAIMYASTYVDRADGQVATNAQKLGIEVRHVDVVERPVNMVLNCPRCHYGHIDAPDPANGWLNPPHRSHQCQSCSWIWRPADVPTNGVASVTTRGKCDS